jgi:hypothetical protein
MAPCVCIPCASCRCKRRAQDDEDAFRWQGDWHPPGKAEDRLKELFIPFTAQLEHPPSFIQLHSGSA